MKPAQCPLSCVRPSVLPSLCNACILLCCRVANPNRSLKCQTPLHGWTDEQTQHVVQHVVCVRPFVRWWWRGQQRTRHEQIVDVVQHFLHHRRHHQFILETQNRTISENTEQNNKTCVPRVRKAATALTTAHKLAKMADEADEQLFILACSCVILSSVLQA